jgi:hypothetical protein
MKFHKANATTPKSSPFFKSSDYATEDELKRYGHKWEPVLHRTDRFRSSSLLRPVFDIHYVARESGGVASSPHPVRYAIVVTVENQNEANLYDRVLSEYSTILEPIEQLVQVPMSVS